MKKLIGVAGISALVCSATAFGAPDPARVPLANAVEKNAENSAKNPQARGLQNAREHLLDNAKRQQEKRASNPPGQHKLGVRASSDRAQLADRTERVERVERPDRPDRPDRPNRPDRPDRPERPHR